VSGNNEGPGGSNVKLYSDCQYRGGNLSLAEGAYNNLFSMLGGRQVLSIYVPRGMVVELYASPNFTGRLIARHTNSVACIANYGDRQAKSARIYYMGGDNNNWNEPAVSIYTACSFGGLMKELQPGNYANLAIQNIYTLSSIQLMPGYGVEFYSKTNFMGTSSGIVRSDSRCVGTYWRDNARSARVFRLEGNTGSGGNYRMPTIFSECNYAGASQEMQPGKYNVGSSYNGVRFNPVSFIVPPGFEIILHSSTSLNGTTAVLQDNTTCLGEYWRNNTRAVVVRKTGRTITPVD
jgi:hypothetical protein